MVTDITIKYVAQNKNSMKKLSAIQSQIRSLQRQIAEGTYGQGKLTKVVNKLNELKSIEYKLINQRNEN